MAAWVLYKLDGGIDHVLIDEAQDTNPDQWRVVNGADRRIFRRRGTPAGRQPHRLRRRRRQAVDLQLPARRSAGIRDDAPPLCRPGAGRSRPLGRGGAVDVRSARPRPCSQAVDRVLNSAGGGEGVVAPGERLPAIWPIAAARPAWWKCGLRLRPRPARAGALEAAGRKDQGRQSAARLAQLIARRIGAMVGTAKSWPLAAARSAPAISWCWCGAATPSSKNWSAN